MDAKADPGYYYSYLEVDLGQIRKNFQNMQAVCKRKLIPVVKGNAWGQGTVPVAAMLFDSTGVETIAVAHISEAVKIREAGYTRQTIMILSGVPFHAIPYAVKYRLMMMVYNRETAERLGKAVREAGIGEFPVQIKIDTGFHRIGVTPEKLPELIEAIREQKNLKIEGICSHYADCYEYGSARTYEQYEMFRKSVILARRMGENPRYISIGCSPNVDWPDEEICTHVRVGWGYIAYSPDPGFEYFHHNRPSMTLRTFITDIHHLPAGEPIGYDGEILTRATDVATISIGTCDGLYRPLVRGKGKVLIRGEYPRYLSTCMDQAMIDVTGIPVRIGDEVTIFGKDKYSDAVLTPTELADYADGNSTILHLYLSDRVARIYRDSFGLCPMNCG